MQLVNPALVMLLIPFTTGGVYPFFQAAWLGADALRRMPLGIALGATAFVIAGILNMPVAPASRISILWQIVPMWCSPGEILVSVTGLEFAYTQAPLTMEERDPELLDLTTAAANLAVALASALAFFTGTACSSTTPASPTWPAVGLALVRAAITRSFRVGTARARPRSRRRAAPALGAEPA